MGIPSMEYLRLSPGELERYTKDAAREVMLSLSRSHSPWPCASTSQRWRPTSPAFRPHPRALPRMRAVKGNYDLVDLVSLSVASTVGSGVFSLAGRVANQEAGPAVVVSLGIGALGCLLSATAYAELSSRVVKLSLILFMIVTALAAFDVTNLQPFIPEAGLVGILRGATDSFFGFLGFDAVCALAMDTKDARRVVPTALFLGLFISGGITCVAGLALVSCVPSERLDPSAGFVSAFEQLQMDGAALLVAVHRKIRDGFLPAFLAHKKRGEPLVATVLGGAVTALCAGLVPFEDLNDICSAAVLTCFIFASVSAIIARLTGVPRVPGVDLESLETGFSDRTRTSAVVHLISILTSAALITTLPAYSLASSAAFLLAVRRQASLAAQQQRKNLEQKKWLEEKAVKTVEVRAELAAKRVQLQGLLKLKEACHHECNAMESAQLRQVEDQARRCAAEALEAERQKQEALRCLEACRQHKASKAEQLQVTVQRRKQREALRSMERQRAAEAAALGRAGQEAQKLVEQRWKREADLQQAEGEEKVLKTDISGLQQLSKTCVKVLHEVTLEAEEQPRQKAPEPSPAQRQAARSRGLAAQQQLRAERQEKEAERQKQDMEKKERCAKAAAVAQRGGPAWSVELLPWRMGNNCKAAQHELSQILASNDASVPREKLRKEPSSHSQQRRCRSTGKMPRKKKSPRTGCIATWQGPTTVWPTVEEVKVSGSTATMEFPPNPEEPEISKEPSSPTEPIGAASIPSSEEPKVLLPAPRPVRPILDESERSEALKSTRVGEEDLAMRLDDICRELDMVGLCAWEADDEL
eukprot:symbB.v1.2.000358.t1/scaffold10.1/size534768/11